MTLRPAPLIKVDPVGALGRLYHQHRHTQQAADIFKLGFGRAWQCCLSDFFSTSALGVTGAYGLGAFFLTGSWFGGLQRRLKYGNLATPSDVLLTFAWMKGINHPHHCGYKRLPHDSGARIARKMQTKLMRNSLEVRSARFSLGQY